MKAQSRSSEAAQCFRRVVVLDPANFRAHFHLGNALKDQSLHAEAAACYRQTLELNPQHADALNNLGILLKVDGQHAQAADCYRQALRIQPRHVDALHNLGVFLSDQKRWSEAAECFRQAIEVDPGIAAAQVHLANVLCQQGLLEVGVTHYRQALALEPANAEAHHNLATTLRDLGMFDEAQVHYDAALRVLPGNKAVLFNRAHLRLLRGDFASAWDGYEYRGSLPGKQPRLLAQPRWDGSPFLGKRLLVTAEGGLGDSIQFVRYLPMVKERGGSVLLECQPALTGLFARLDGADVVVPSSEARLPAFDLQVPLLSLPGIFKTTLPTIPAPLPYLHADAHLIQHWRNELARRVDCQAAFQVGVAWQGNAENRGDFYRSLPLASFESLARIDNVTLVSLQVGPGAAQMREVTFPVVDLASQFNPAKLDGLAAAMMCLDLVITVETSVAHLAGALGVPVWTLLAIAPDWRWLLDRSDSPWYPTMRLFRQKKFGAWPEVIKQVEEQLRAHAARK